jgi:hypothetical protein
MNEDYDYDLEKNERIKPFLIAYTNELPFDYQNPNFHIQKKTAWGCFGYGK